MPAIAVLGAQWGDEGKGKISHLVSENADYSVRFNGGTNAGHTVFVGNSANGKNGHEKSKNGNEFKFHLIPSGALHPGCAGVLGNGMVLEPFSLAKEIKELEDALGKDAKIFISERAHLILPYHPILEGIEGSKSELDTTAKGIGPAYQDKVARRGLRAVDLLNPTQFLAKLQRNLDQLKGLYPHSKPLADLDAQKIAREILTASERFRDKITNTTALLHKALKADQQLVFEGAQACLLDIDFGTYPYVTSSHATIGGIGVGAGVPPNRIQRVIGVAKAFTSRVGSGPFPTEDLGEMGQRLRGTGANPWDEFGTTTGRPRRCGWLDLVALKYAADINGFTELALVKLDILSELGELKVATAYELDGEILDYFPSHCDVLARCKPVYETLPSWSESLRDCRSLSKLPKNAKNYVKFIEQVLDVPVTILSVGRAFEETISAR
ncbi:adenylosuccinate synthase [Candidatus Acetothermia bacterium]|nr:adenylosuccinate synthase [Candidatus Acetothermia bacterium]MBI3643956.1 adenylosuccinate synthase [Candidatus Acetothermia bacterium]